MMSEMATDLIIAGFLLTPHFVFHAIWEIGAEGGWWRTQPKELDICRLRLNMHAIV